VKLSVARFAVEQFNKILADVGPVVQALEGRPLTCLVRQRNEAEDRGWACDALTIDEHSGALLGEFSEKNKRHAIVFDIDSIDSIDFEIAPKHVAQPENEQV